jgi:hypothetical protein
LVSAEAQAYRDRADAENMFDELKNQWGWTGYTTKDRKRSQLMARLVGLTYNWWGIYTRMGTGGRHQEAITTRPSLMEGVAQQTEHARTVKLKMTSVHGKAKTIAAYLNRRSAGPRCCGRSSTNSAAGPARFRGKSGHLQWANCRF